MKMARHGLIAVMLLVLAEPAEAAWEYTRWGMNEAQAVTASRRAVRASPRNIGLERCLRRLGPGMFS